MHKSRTIWAPALVALVGLVIVACEEEPPPAGRGGGPGGGGPAKVAEAKPAAAEGEDGGATEGTTGEAASEETGAVAAVDDGSPARAARVPTASELLGLGRRSGAGGGDELPGFLRNRKRATADGGESPLFTGEAAAPSKGYGKMRISPLQVSPIERHWGVEQDLLGKSRAPEKAAAPVVAPNSQPAGKIFQGKGTEPVPVAEEKPAAPTTAAEGKYRLLLYRLNPNTGAIETFDRSYASKEARKAAESYAQRQGYSGKQPGQEAVAAAKAKLTEGKGKKEEAPAAKKDECKFRAYWTQNKVRQSRCFGSQAQLDAFTASRRAQQKAEQAAKTASPAQGDGALAPVQLPR
ncbi:MAG: hypothetical protein ACI9WU_003801 [Myxococcota bacterium]|jgi:hypothetical protein